MKLIKYILSLSVLGSTLCSASFASTSPIDTDIIAGAYNIEYSGKPTEPLLLISSNKGDTWQAVQKIAGLPENVVGKHLLSISCNGDNCVTVGNADYSNTHLIVLRSHDRGQSWTYDKNVLNLPAQIQLPNLTSVNCMAQYCVATGNYMNDQNVMASLLLVNNNKNEAWSAVTLPANNAAMSMGISTTSVSCNDNFCAVAGMDAYFDNHYNAYMKPKLFFTEDQGNTWNVVENIKGFAEKDNGGLRSVRCDADTCIAVGNRGIDFDHSDYAPLIVVSKDKKSWSSVQSIANLPAEMKHVELETVNCLDKFCVSTGSYQELNNYDHYQNLVLTSQDKGETWSREKDTLNGVQGAFEATSFTADTCVMVGSISEEQHNLPLIVISPDKGKTWTRVQNITGLPTNAGYAQLSTVQCKDNNCFAAGKQYYDNGFKSKPLVLVSHDNAQSWSYVAAIKDLPANLQEIYVNTSTHINKK